MEQNQQIGFSLILEQYLNQKRDYKEIEAEWRKKEEWLESLPSGLLFPVTMLLDFGVDINGLRKLETEKNEKQIELTGSRNTLINRISCEPGEYTFETLEFHPTLRTPGTLITVFQYPLEDELLHIRRHSSSLLIKKNYELKTYKLEIAPLKPPIIHIPRYCLNMIVNGEIEIVDVNHRDYITVEDLSTASKIARK